MADPTSLHPLTLCLSKRIQHSWLRDIIAHTNLLGEQTLVLTQWADAIKEISTDLSLDRETLGTKLSSLSGLPAKTGGHLYNLLAQLVSHLEIMREDVLKIRTQTRSGTWLEYTDFSRFY